MNENYWNDKWPKAPIIYDGRTLKSASDRIGVDVKNFIEHDDEILKMVINKYNLKKPTFDETAFAIQQHVVANMVYKYDDQNCQVPEFWQFPFETVYSKVGDCEDGAILIAALCVNAGIPIWRVKVAAGYVQATPTAPQGGHAYCLYLADDEEWRILDWCYFEDSRTPVKDKPLAKNGGVNNAYKNVWFTFNSEYSWNQTSLTLSGRIANDEPRKNDRTFESVINLYGNLDYI